MTTVMSGSVNGEPGTAGSTCSPVSRPRGWHTATRRSGAMVKRRGDRRDTAGQEPAAEYRRPSSPGAPTARGGEGPLVLFLRRRLEGIGWPGGRFRRLVGTPRHLDGRSRRRRRCRLRRRDGRLTSRHTGLLRHARLLWHGRRGDGRRLAGLLRDAGERPRARRGDGGERLARLPGLPRRDGRTRWRRHSSGHRHTR